MSWDWNVLTTVVGAVGAATGAVLGALVTWLKVKNDQKRVQNETDDAVWKRTREELEYLAGQLKEARSSGDVVTRILDGTRQMFDERNTQETNEVGAEVPGEAMAVIAIVARELLRQQARIKEIYEQTLTDAASLWNVSQADLERSFPSSLEDALRQAGPPGAAAYAALLTQARFAALLSTTKSVLALVYFALKVGDTTTERASAMRFTDALISDGVATMTLPKTPEELEALVSEYPGSWPEFNIEQLLGELSSSRELIRFQRHVSRDQTAS